MTEDPHAILRWTMTRAAGELLAGRYRLERPLGAGGMGEVWVASNTVTGGKVALKFLKEEYAKVQDLRLRFIREARAASSARHPNIVTVHDVLDVESDSPVMVMELLDGESLGDRLARERALTLADVARLIVPALHALSVAHQVGIVHRDLKPDNLFIVKHPDGTEMIKVLDFGIAKMTAAHDDASNALTKTGAMMGTPFYMSPEQAFGEKGIDRRSDVWSMGIILYQCLTGLLPTEANNFGQIVKIITSSGIPPVAEVAPTLPKDVASVITRMLSRVAADRPNDLSEAAAVLQPYASSASADTKFVVAVAGAVPSSGLGKALTAPSLPSSGMSASLVEPRRAVVSWPTILGLAALAGAGLGTQQWLRLSDADRPPTQLASNAGPGVGTAPSVSTRVIDLTAVGGVSDADASPSDAAVADARAPAPLLPVRLVTRPEGSTTAPVHPPAASSNTTPARPGPPAPAGSSSGRVSDRLAPTPF